MVRSKHNCLRKFERHAPSTQSKHRGMPQHSASVKRTTNAVVRSPVRKSTTGNQLSNSLTCPGAALHAPASSTGLLKRTVL
uniref:Uncharacterized protein n=1 Tax=Ascaris lumbricoides TaxID=6252 RepID=A0A0M3IBL1_ASCLU